MTIGSRPIEQEGLRFGPLGADWVHLCIDMQRMFAEQTEWHTPWMERVLPNVVRLVELQPARTIFTRFIPPPSSDDVAGTWRRYYRRWSSMTRNELPAGLIELVPELASFVPPAQVEDKTVMSAWAGSLHARLAARTLTPFSYQVLRRRCAYLRPSWVPLTAAIE